MNSDYEEQGMEKGGDTFFHFQKEAASQSQKIFSGVEKILEDKIKEQNVNNIAALKEKACLQSKQGGTKFFDKSLKKTKRYGYQELRRAEERKFISMQDRRKRMFEKTKSSISRNITLNVKGKASAETAKIASKATGGLAKTGSAAVGTVASPIAGMAVEKVISNRIDKHIKNIDEAKRMADIAKENYMKEERIRMTYGEDTKASSNTVMGVTEKVIKKVLDTVTTLLVSAAVILPIIIPIILIVFMLIILLMIVCSIFGGNIMENELDAGAYLDNMVYYSQLDPEWSSYTYGNGTIASSGCGITCMAMCVATFADSSVTPPDMATLSMENGGYISGQGSAMSVVVTVAARQYDLKYSSISASEIKSYIEKKDALVIWGCQKGTFSNSTAGHVMIIRDVKDDNYYLADPAHEDRNTKEYALSDITSQSKGYYYAIWSDEGRLTSDMESMRGDNEQDLRKQIVSYAKKFKGNPYVYGGTSLTEGTDCSGFTMRIYEHFHITLPRTTAEQYQKSRHIKKKDLKPGDLCFYKDKDGNIGHVAMYIGNNKVIHASNPVDGIIISNMGYRKASYYGSYISEDISEYTEEDLLYLSAVMDAESSGYDANVAVGYCVMNRKKSKRFPNSVKGVVTQSGQFTSDWASRVSGKKKISSTAKKAAKAVLMETADNPIGTRVYFRNIATYKENAKKSGWHSPVYIYQAYDTDKTQGNVFFKEKNEK